MTQQEIYKQAIEKYGTESQIRIAVEEMSELTNALMKMPRGRATAPDVITEIADVCIMMQQLSIIFGEDAVEKEISYKTNRLKFRLNGELKE